MRKLRSPALSLSLAAIALAIAPAAFAEEASGHVVIHCGAVIDPAMAPQPLLKRSLIIDKGRISRIDEGFVAADGAQVIDLSNSFCLPGLIDSHTHLTTDFGKGSYLNKFTDTTADQAYKAARNAKITLLAGFTTTRDLGSSHQVDTALRTAIERGDVPGPRLLVATNALSITGGHGDPIAGFREELGHSDEYEGVADGVPSAIRATRIAIRRGADVIKIMATGGVLSVGDSGSAPQFSLEEMRAICETAHDHGLKVTAHAHGDEGARRAVIAGVASIEHGTYLTDKTYELMKRQQVFLVPTVIAGMTAAENARVPGFFPPSVAAKALEIGPLMVAALSRAWKAGVPIAFGTDAGVYPHGLNGREFAYMVEAGMPPIEAIRAATQNAARLLGKPADIGSVQPGHFADVIAVDSNPLQDIDTLQSIAFVMKQGRVYKLGGQPQAF